MVDLHSHILPGVDDGAATLAESVALARAAVADGTEVLAATPHVRSDYPTDPATMERLVDGVRAAVEQAGVPLRVLPGGEIALDALPSLDDAALRRFGLGGNPRVLLLEFPYQGWPLHLHDAVFGLGMRGFATVLAHPERNAEVQAQPERLLPLVEAGALVQVTAASVDGRLGRRTQATARRLVKLGLAHLLASDAHVPAVRQVGLTAACEALGSGQLARWLATDVPAAIVAGTPLPPRPPAPQNGLRLPWRRGRGI